MRKPRSAPQLTLLVTPATPTTDDDANVFDFASYHHRPDVIA
jgi:hypothetical protein